MIKDLVMSPGYSTLQSAVTILFVTLFVGMLIWINRKGSDSYYKKAEHLALEEGEKSGKK